MTNKCIKVLNLLSLKQGFPIKLNKEVVNAYTGI